MSDAALVREATETINKGSKSFAAAARLFAPAMRESAVMLYAWCRHCDDVVDGQELGFRTGRETEGSPAERLARLERDTRAVLAGEPATEPAFAALGEVVRRHDIPSAWPLAHLAGFRLDVEGRRYQTIGDTLEYCYGVAGVVGLMMAHVMGVRDPAVLDRACDLGIAFQLTNIARDLVEDAEVGRVYAPAKWLTQASLKPKPSSVAARKNRDALATVAARLVAQAEPYYDSAAIGIRALPPRAAWAIATASAVYRAIGLEVVRRRGRAWDRRVSTSKAEKVGHVIRGASALLPNWTRPEPRPHGLYARPA